MTAQKKFKVTVSDVLKAQKNLAEYLVPTPVVKNEWLSEEFKAEIYLKLETLQPIGSFKIRGAMNKMLHLTPKQKQIGVIAASAGNHAQGVAWAARRLGIDALIYMPETATLVKLQNTLRLGATVELKGKNYDEAYAAAQKVCKETGRVFVHPYEDPLVIAGQGTVALELLEQLPDMDFVVASMGGGGLMTGISHVLREKARKVQIVGCQAKGAATLVKSLKAGKAMELPYAHTFADGILVKQASAQMVKLLRSHVDHFVTPDDEQIAAAVLSLMEKAKQVVEGSGAITLAALEKIRSKIKGKKVVLVISGGNIDFNVLYRIIDVGMIRSGRRLRLNVLLADRPGSLFRLAKIIALEGANVLQAIHDRSEPAMTINQTDVNLTLETKGVDHSESVIRRLRKEGFNVERVR